MRTFTRFLACAALAAAFGLGGAALAAAPQDNGDPSHGAGHSGAGHGPANPPRGFHSAPPSFHGPLPGYHGNATGGPPRAGQYQVGRPGHDLGAFNGRNFSRFTPDQRSAWEGGAWRHVEHNGHLGWWWVVGDLWFFYPAPIYPYPEYVGPDYYYDYYDYYPAPTNYWYYCEDPPGYYPQVQVCNVPWEPVPPQY